MATDSHPLRADTHAVSVPVDAQTLFAFLAEPRNLPRWAVGFCLDIRPVEDGRWIVQTGHGEVPIQYVTHPALGVIDYHMQPAPGVEVVAVSRVVPNGDGAEYVFTQLQAPGMPDEVFEGQRHALREELEVLRRLFLARTACARAR